MQYEYNNVTLKSISSMCRNSISSRRQAFPWMAEYEILDYLKRQLRPYVEEIARSFGLVQ